MISIKLKPWPTGFSLPNLGSAPGSPSYGACSAKKIVRDLAIVLIKTHSFEELRSSSTDVRQPKEISTWGSRPRLYASTRFAGCHLQYMNRRHFSLAFLYGDRKSTRLNSSHGYISYAVFCLKK